MATVWYKDLTTILQLIPIAQTLIEWIVKLIQNLFPNKTGAEKKTVAMKYAAIVVPEIPPEVASRMIDATVTVFKEAEVAGFINDVTA